MAILTKAYTLSRFDRSTQYATNVNFDDLYDFINDEHAGGLFHNVKSYGAVGNGSTNDTTAIESAISAANADLKPLFFPPGTYVVTPGGLSEINVSIIAPEAFFEASSSTDSPLLAVNYDTGRSGTNSSPTAYFVDIGGLVGSSSFSGAGTGLHVKQSARNKFIVRQTNWLKYGVHLDCTWTSGAPMPTIYENYFWIKSDSGTVGLQITTNNDAAGVPIDANYFFMGSSFNHDTACVRISAGTNSGTSDVHNNTFVFQMLEIGRTNSDGIVCTGLARGNQFYIYNQRGVNGTGVYGRTDSNSTNNYFHVHTWVPGNWSFSTNQHVKALDSLDASTQLQGRSMFFAPDVTTAVSTTIPSAVGDIILHTDPGIGDNLGWICTTAGTSGTWTPFGMRTAVLMGQTDATGVSAGATQYFPAQGAMTNATSANVSMPLPAAGTLRRFYAKASAAPSAGDTFTIKLVKNGSLVSPTITISDAATTASDTSTTVSVSKADTINWEVTASAGTPANTIISVGMELLVDPS